jgi:Flp pilus assembly protein TadG
LAGDATPNPENKEAKVKYIHSSRELCSQFWKDRRGNFAMTMALASIPIFGLAGMAIDYTSLANTRSRYQNALENGALAAAIAGRTKPWKTAEVEGKNAFTAAMLNTDASGLVDVKFTYDSKKQKVNAVASGKSPTTLSAVVGVKEFEFEVESEVVLPNYPIEVAMVLDTTYSMTADNKIGDLKFNATNFVNTLKQSPTADVKIGIVPFADYARISTSFAGKSWLNVIPYSVVVQKAGWYTTKTLVSKSGCKMVSKITAGYWTAPVAGYWTAPTYADGVIVTPSKWIPAKPAAWIPEKTTTSEVCDKYNYNETSVWKPEIVNNYPWLGCVGSRKYPLNIKDEKYDTDKVPGLAELQSSVCGMTTITPLTKDKNTLTTAISALKAAGSTYIPAGLTWGIRLLSNQEPYDQAMTTTELNERGGKRFLVLMTDGDNTVAPKTATAQKHDNTTYATANALANKYTAEGCTYAKSMGITVYTVSFGKTVNATTKDMLQKCASNPANYFDASAGDDLAAAFEAIAQGILKLYVSR